MPIKIRSSYDIIKCIDGQKFSVVAIVEFFLWINRFIAPQLLTFSLFGKILSLLQKIWYIMIITKRNIVSPNFLPFVISSAKNQFCLYETIVKQKWNSLLCWICFSDCQWNLREYLHGFAPCNFHCHKNIKALSFWHVT